MNDSTTNFINPQIFKGHHYEQAEPWRVRFLLLYVLLSVIAVLIIAGCVAVGPDYARVEPDASEKWHTQLQGGLNPGVLEPEILAQWWRSLNDSILLLYNDCRK